MGVGVRLARWRAGEACVGAMVELAAVVASVPGAGVWCAWQAGALGFGVLQVWLMAWAGVVGIWGCPWRVWRRAWA